MACKGFLECLLKLLNFLLTLVGLAMVGYGIYLLVMYKNATDDIDIVRSNEELIQLGRPMLMSVSLSGNSFYDSLPTAWFIYLFIGAGAILFVISCFGCIGAKTTNGCCLNCYSVLVILLIVLELGCAAFIFFDKSWRSEMPTDKTGEFDMIYEFLKKNWNICKWVVLGAVILEGLILLLALMVRANAPADYDSDDGVEYDSDDDYINGPRQQRQPLISRQSVAAEYDAWSARIWEQNTQREEFFRVAAHSGLNPEYESAIQQILTSSTAPNMRYAFRRSMTGTSVVNTNASPSVVNTNASPSAFVARTKKGRNNKRPYCEYCRKLGHKEDKCWKKHGRPVAPLPQPSSGSTHAFEASSRFTASEPQTQTMHMTAAQGVIPPATSQRQSMGPFDSGVTNNLPPITVADRNKNAVSGIGSE